jgi:hypothetical protein
MSPYGPSRHFPATQQLGRFRREADIKWQAGPTSKVAIEPWETLGVWNCCPATAPLNHFSGPKSLCN